MRYIMEKGRLKQVSKAHGELFCSAPICLVRESKKIEVDDEVESRTSSTERYKLYHARCFDAMEVGHDKRLDRAILATFVFMWIIWGVCDLLQIIKTPLSPLGMNHWILEGLFFFLMGYEGGQTVYQMTIIVLPFAWLAGAFSSFLHHNPLHLVVWLAACGLFIYIFNVGLRVNRFLRAHLGLSGRLWAIMRTFYHVIGLAAVFGCAVSAMVITILLLLSGSGSVVILEENQFVLVLEVVFCFIGATYAFRLMCRMVRARRSKRNEAQRVR